MPEFLYIHIPFCIKKCLYCDFFSVSYDESTVKAYIDALCKELYLKKDLANTLKTIYIGGGTPSLLPGESFQQLFQCIRDNFHLSPDVEITVEANPGAINKSKINTLLSLGVNRLSIGIQSFHDNELKLLGRIHTSEDSLRLLELMKKAGMNNFSIDFMYGIPGQTMDLWHKTISKAIGFLPNHISAYELTLEEDTPLYRLVKSNENNSPSPPFTKGGKGGLCNQIQMPDEDLVIEMYNHVIDYLIGHGYEHYEISNFALPGYKCIHNLNYWDRGEYIGAGAGAHSFYNDVRLRNTQDIKQYIENLNNGTIPEIESTRLTRVDALKEFIFLELRKTGGINIPKSEDLGLNILDASRELIDDGYLEVKNGYLSLTRNGIVISNTVIVKVFEKLGL
ncbi:MAG: radical SAM family heme chaperone HemW [Nitrospira sp.]|nr:radical SAM family heme chaperone HemW [Nitrospira sp.]